MLYHNIRVMAHSLRFIDTGTVLAVGWVVLGWGAGAGLWAETPLRGSLTVFSLTSAAAFLYVGERLKLYHAHRTEDGGREFAALFEAVLSSVALGCIFAQIAGPGLPARFYLTVLPATVTGLLALRAAMRILVRRLRRKGGDQRTWLMVGRNARSAALVDTVDRNPHFGIRIDQIVDLPSRAGDTRGLDNGSVLARYPNVSLPSADCIREILAEKAIDEVVVSLPLRSFYDDVQKIIEICSQAGVSVKLHPQAFEREGNSTEMSLVGDMPMVTHFTGPANYMQLVVKRIIDVAGSALGLLLLTPLFAVIAVAIKANTRGPVFFTQTRVGLHGRRFRMFKFRSMTADAPMRQAELIRYNASDEVVFKMRNDPRVTPVGRLIRKFHLDELPQLWNVLIGDMSLVGPRPLPLSEAECKEWWHRRRLSMPPGLTCFWQVAGDHKMPFQKWMKLDMDYIDDWSVWLDLKIIVSTFATVAKGKGW